MTMRFEPPARYLDEPVEVRALAGETTVATSSFLHEDSWTFEVPIEALTKTEGRITIVSSRTFVPAERNGVADRRRLGLRACSNYTSDRVGLR